MSSKLDQIVVIDVECTCWQDEPPEGEQSEIIEIGVCALAIPSGERGVRDSILVRPEHSRVSPFCTELTTLRQEQVDGGITFRQACEKLRKRYSSRDRVWASYGDYDRRMFEQQCREGKIPYPFGATHINVKNLFALMHGLSYEVELPGALEILGRTLEGTHHRGGDDAWNVAIVLAEILHASD